MAQIYLDPGVKLNFEPIENRAQYFTLCDRLIDNPNDRHFNQVFDKTSELIERFGHPLGYRGLFENTFEIQGYTLEDLTMVEVHLFKYYNFVEIEYSNNNGRYHLDLMRYVGNPETLQIFEVNEDYEPVFEWKAQPTFFDGIKYNLREIIRRMRMPKNTEN